jgi:hypothetical protein
MIGSLRLRRARLRLLAATVLAGGLLLLPGAHPQAKATVCGYYTLDGGRHPIGSDCTSCPTPHALEGPFGAGVGSVLFHEYACVH